MNLEYEQRLELSDWLFSLAFGEPEDPGCGICWNLSSEFPDCETARWFWRAVDDGIYKWWEHYSGDNAYPVPGPKEYATCRWPEMSAYLDSIPKWDRNTEYGRMRRDLAKYLSTAVLTWREEPEDET